MYNSSILSWLGKLLSLLNIAYRESTFNRLYVIIDDFLKKAALNSKIIGLFINKKGRGFIESSMLYRMIAKVLKYIYKLGKKLVFWINESFVISTTESIINQAFKNSYRIFGIFAVSFLIVNIVFALISRREDRIILIFKIVLLIISLLAVRLDINFEKTLKNSKFYKIFKWIVEVEK